MVHDSVGIQFQGDRFRGSFALVGHEGDFVVFDRQHQAVDQVRLR